MACKLETQPPNFSMILLGKSGSGKSSAGNTILGQRAFLSKISSVSTTQEVQMENVNLDGVSIDVHDTPGFYNTEQRNEEVMNKCQALILLDRPYPTVFLLVIPIGRFTSEERRTVESVQNLLGENNLQNTWILFTRGDMLDENESIEVFIRKTSDLNQVVQRFNNRYHVFSNRTHNPEQVRKLLDKMEKSPLNMCGLMTMAWTANNIPPSCNIIVLGKSGVGKSATANTILNLPHFISSSGFRSVTLKTQKSNVRIDNVSIDVYDTPGLYNTALSNEEVLSEYKTLLQLADQAPCVFLLVMKPERPTQEVMSTVREIETLLGQRLLQNTWILFTRGDELERDRFTIEDFLEVAEDLKELVQRFQNRFHVFNNKTFDSDQVRRLMEKMQSTTLNLSVRLPWTKHRSVRRIVLLGGIHSDKSVIRNALIGREHFSRSSFHHLFFSLFINPVTKKSGHAGDRNVCVIDTPVFMHPDPDYVFELRKGIYLSSPGPHAFLIVLRVHPWFWLRERFFTQHVEGVLGNEVAKYAIILFTYGDQLSKERIERAINEDWCLKELVQKCGGRYLLFNSADRINQEQVTELMEKIDRMVDQNEGSHFSLKQMRIQERLEMQRKIEELRQQREYQPGEMHSLQEQLEAQRDHLHKEMHRLIQRQEREQTLEELQRLQEEVEELDRLANERRREEWRQRERRRAERQRLQEEQEELERRRRESTCHVM